MKLSEFIRLKIKMESLNTGFFSCIFQAMASAYKMVRLVVWI